jgi:hypothetical protein
MLWQLPSNYIAFNISFGWEVSSHIRADRPLLYRERSD